MGAAVGVFCLAAGGVGIAFASGVVTRTATVTVPPKAKRAATAKCPKGKSVVMGGFHNDIGTNHQPEVNPIGLTRPSKRAWRDSATDAFPPAGDATAIAYCGRAPKLTERTKSVAVPAATSSTNRPTSVTARCPKGQRVAFGGFKADFDPNFGPNTGAIWINTLRRTSNRAWKAAGWNFGNDVGNLTSVAYCGHVAKTTEHSASVPVKVNQRRSATAHCPKGQKLAFGGFVAPLGNDEFVQIDSARRASRRAWTAQAVNTSSSLMTGTLRSLAYCR
jgi:hypothetical protein